MAKKKMKPLTGNDGDFSGIVLKAAARGDSVAVNEYLKVNPGWLNREGPHGRTLLWEATYKGRLEMVAELIAMGANVNTMGSYYTPMLVELSPLAVARSAGRNELVQLLEQHGALDDLYAACYRGDLEAINHFLANDPQAVNRPARDLPSHPRMGFHPIHYAVVGKQLGALRLLIGYGAAVSEYLTLLIDWSDGDRNLIRVLREQAKQESPKQNRSSKKSPKKQLQKDNIPVIDRPDWLGFPPLVDACRGNHNAPDDPARVQKLLQRGANVNITDHKGKTPLHRSSQAGFSKITTLLLKHGARLEAIDDKGCTPIFDAAHHGRVEVLKLLIDRGVNIHHTEARGETPLFAAARGGRAEAFEVLLAAGSDLTHKNARDKTAFDIVSGSKTMNAESQQIMKLKPPSPSR